MDNFFFYIIHYPLSVIHFSLGRLAEIELTFYNIVLVKNNYFKLFKEVI